MGINPKIQSLLGYKLQTQLQIQQNGIVSAHFVPIVRFASPCYTKCIYLIDNLINYTMHLNW